MKKLSLVFTFFACVMMSSFSYGQNYDGNYDGQPVADYAAQGYDGGDGSADCGAPCDQLVGDCVCKYVHWEPCYYNKWHCNYEPKYTYKKCCRQVPQYYQKQCCRYVPQYYCQTCCRYVPDYYYTCSCQYCPKYSCERCCKYVPRYYYKRTDCGTAGCCQAPACN